MNKSLSEKVPVRVLKGWAWLKRQNPHFVWLSLVLLAFLASMSFSEPVAPRQSATPSATAAVTAMPASLSGSETPAPQPVSTPLPAELIANREQTFGIVFGSVMLVLIVVIGTLSGIAARRRNQKDG